MHKSPVIILAGGLGTRLSSYLEGKPKPLADINGKPFLEYILLNLIENGYTNFVFSLNYKSELIIDFINSNNESLFKNCIVEYFVEPEQLGTGGAIAYIISKKNDLEDFFVLNADTWIEKDLDKLEPEKVNTIALVEVENTSRFGSVEIDENNVILNFNEKQVSYGPGLINAGFYKLNKSLFKNWNQEPYSLESDLFPKLVQNKQLKGLVLQSNFIDIGIPKDYLLFCEINKSI